MPVQQAPSTPQLSHYEKQSKRISLAQYKNMQKQLFSINYSSPLKYRGVQISAWFQRFRTASWFHCQGPNVPWPWGQNDHAEQMH